MANRKIIDMSGAILDYFKDDADTRDRSPDITDMEEAKKVFRHFPEEIAWGDYCNSTCEWLHQLQEDHMAYVVEKGDIFASDKVFFSEDFGKIFGFETVNSVGIESTEEAINDLDEGQRLVLIYSPDDDEYRLQKITADMAAML